jgi:ATP-dependent DNA helicase RecQ
MIANYSEALQFTDDYFTLDYTTFLKKYFPKRLHEISRPLTPEKFKAIFGALSPEQLEIINDNKSEHILVAAGPGSGKTKVVVHKVASLLMLEDIKPEGFLMLTFSRAAVLEFKERLHALIGNVAYYIDIHTYHSYCFNLMGRVGSLEKSDTVISECIKQIVDGIIPEGKIGIKSVLVVDEFQDINEQESHLLAEIISRCEKIRVLVVGDDDQNIYEFRGSSVKYMQDFESQNKARRYELITNFRSKQNLVAFANQFVATIPHRMKKEHIVAKVIEDGSICIHQYTSSNLITPLINSIASTELSGTTAVLTATNREATIIESLLKERGLPARRILSHEGFSLSELLEIKSFTNLLKSTISASSQMIAEDVWQETKNFIKEEYKQSKNLWLFEAITACFEKNYTRKIIFEWGLFLKESRFEDFYYPEKNIITVSTIHKAKGKEFDNVFLLLDEFEITQDAHRRIIYVAITRAKQNLIIHTNTSHFNKFHVSYLKILIDTNLYQEPKDLYLYLNHRDVFLNCFKHRLVAYAIDKMRAGEKLHIEIDGHTLTDSSSKKVGVLSKEFQKTLKKHIEDGYEIKDIEVDFIVYWKDAADNGEYKVLLPKFALTKLVNHTVFS